MKKTVKTDSDVMDYFMTYGYMSEETRGKPMDMESQEMKKMVKEFQQNMGLEESGALNEETMTAMNMPRCGVPDTAEGMEKAGAGAGNRVKRYMLQGSKWPEPEVTWRVSRYSQRLSLVGRKKEIDLIFDEALKTWSKSSKLKFKRIHEGKADIDIEFGRRSHGDRNAFDGRGKTLAHAYFPRYGGDAHFDDDEKWTLSGKVGTNLMSVAIHEFGHSLGLAHSPEKKAIMYASYTGQTHLGSDDSAAIVALYGKREVPKELPAVGTSGFRSGSARSRKWWDGFFSRHYWNRVGAQLKSTFG
jgi:matrix metalloproteinase-14 (membrane-inserted)